MGEGGVRRSLACASFLRPLLGYALAGIREFGPVPIGDLLLVVVVGCWLMMMMMMVLLLLLLCIWQCSNGNAARGGLLVGRSHKQTFAFFVFVSMSIVSGLVWSCGPLMRCVDIQRA